MRKILSVVLGLLLVIAAGAAPVIRIKGKVIDTGTNRAIDFADVFLMAGDGKTPVGHTLVAADGSFALSDVKDGKYTLMVRLVGYDVYTKEVTLAQGTTVLDVGTVALSPLEIGIADVEVVARKKQIVYKLDKKVVEASASLLASGGTAVDILENTPSIRVDAEGEVTFRGSSGFAVYIDGKPSIYSGSQALQQIPSSTIDNIEIITTPSARHDTGSDVGIINIITKKNYTQGLNGMVNSSVSTIGTRTVDFLLSRQSGRARWYFGGDFSDRMLKSNFEQEKETVVNDWLTHSYSKGPRESDNFSYSGKGGWMYSLPKTTINVELEGGYAGRYRIGNLDYKEEQRGYSWQTETQYRDYFSRDYYNIDQTFLTLATGFDHSFGESHKLSGQFYYKHAVDALEYFQSDLYDSDVDKNLLNNPHDSFREAEKNYRATKKKGAGVDYTPGNEYENKHRQLGHHAYEDEIKPTLRVNLDYTKPIAGIDGGRIDAGYQYFSYLEDGAYSMEFWNKETNSFEYRSDDAIYDNYFYFQNGINSLYLIHAGNIRSFSYQAGLRGEHTHRVLRTDVAHADRTYNNFHLFPSVHLGYTMPQGRQLTASYSRRITRPSLFYMEPYITYRDFYSAEIGNPDIQNEFINSFELNYKANLGSNSISATAFHRSRANKIERLRIPYESAIRSGVTLDSMANVGNDYSSGLELNAQVQPLRFWNITVNGSFYHYRVVNKLARTDKDETSANYDITVNNGFDLLGARLQLDGNFVGPSVTTQGRTDAYWYVNIALRQQFLKRSLSATISMRDVFNSATYISNITSPGLTSVTHIKPVYPLISLTLTYTFNNYRAKSSSASDDRNLFEGTNH